MLNHMNEKFTRLKEKLFWALFEFVNERAAPSLVASDIWAFHF